MTTTCADLRIQRPWLYYKSGVDFLHDFWPISPSKPELVEDQLYGPGYVQKMMQRFALLASKSKYGAPTQCPRAGFQARRIKSYEEQASRCTAAGGTTMRSTPIRRHPSCPVAEVDASPVQSSTPGSVSELKRKFEQLCSLAPTNSVCCTPNRRNVYRCTPVRFHNTPGTVFEASPFGSFTRTPDVFAEPSFQSDASITSSVSKSDSSPPRKRPLSSDDSGKPIMATAVNVDQSNTGLMEMNRLLEKFRQNREHRMRNQASENSTDEKPPLKPECPSTIAKAELTSSEMHRKASPALRPSPRPSVTVRESRQNKEQSTINNRLSEIRGISQVGCVVASYVSGPEHQSSADGKSPLQFRASISLSDSDSDCSSYDPEECQKTYHFENAYIVPTKSSMNTVKASTKNNIVVFSNEPPLAYVYLEENEAEVIGHWQAGEDVTMESYFCIKEQMREERSRSLENGIN